MPAQSERKSKPPGAVYAVCGTELFLKQQAMDRLADAALGRADRTLALSEYEGSNVALALADVLDELRTLPFLAERRLVIVRDADAFITRYRQELETYVEQPSPTGVLLLECKSLPSNTRLHKRIAAVGEVVKCDPVAARAVPAWLTSRCQETYGKRLDARAGALLADQIGSDLGLLDGELQKLALYVGDRPQINADDVEALVGRCREEQVWGILSAIAGGNQAQAIDLWEEVWQTDRAASGRSVAGIAYKVRQLLDAKYAEAAGASMDELRKRMMIWRDDQRLKAELGAFTLEQVELMLCKLQEADVAAKTGGRSVRSSIEAFIIEMCGQRKARRRTG